jgi:neutral ceramidase
MGLKTLCVAAYGASFMAGAEDGRSGPLGEGLALGSTMTEATLNAARATLTALVSVLMPPLGPVVGGAMIASSDPCQLPKPVLVPSGTLANWTPTILPFQLFRLGPVAIAAIPGEMTMQAGRRLQDSLKVVLAPIGVNQVILTGLANEYSGYITTPEEYDSQQYEGASTLFGRLTFDAYQQAFRELAVAMVTGQPAASGLPIPDLSAIPQIELQTGVFRDDLQIGETFGQVLVQPEPVNARGGAPVHVAFRSGHPKNDLRRNNTYFRIERDAGGGNWELAAWDSQPETRLYWGRPTSCPTDPCALSQMDVFWFVPTTATPGSYRIRLVGSWKNGQTGALTRYEGRSNLFTVQ